MEKSTKEIADYLHLDKQTIYRFIKKNNLIESHQKNGTKYYSEAHQTFINKHFSKKNTSRSTSKKEHEHDSNDSMISILKEELIMKNKQIEELQKLLSQQQQLQLMEQKKMHLLLDEAKQAVDEQKSTNNGSKSFFKSLFNKM